MNDNNNNEEKEVIDSTSIGLGDTVAKIANPIAKVLDRIVGTEFSTCLPCKRRQEFLNKAVPYKLDP